MFQSDIQTHNDTYTYRHELHLVPRTVYLVKTKHIGIDSRYYNVSLCVLSHLAHLFIVFGSLSSYSFILFVLAKLVRRIAINISISLCNVLAYHPVIHCGNTWFLFFFLTKLINIILHKYHITNIKL
jgi:hypothetical protein